MENRIVVWEINRCSGLDRQHMRRKCLVFLNQTRVFSIGARRRTSRRRQKPYHYARVVAALADGGTWESFNSTRPVTEPAARGVVHKAAMQKKATAVSLDAVHLEKICHAQIIMIIQPCPAAQIRSPQLHALQTEQHIRSQPVY